MNAFDGRFSALQITGKRDYQEDSFGLLGERDLGLEDSEHAALLVCRRWHGWPRGRRDCQ